MGYRHSLYDKIIPIYTLYLQSHYIKGSTLLLNHTITEYY